MKETRLTPSDPAFVQVDRLHPPRDQQHVVEIDQQAELEPVFRCVHGGEKTIQWSACVCAGAGGVKVGHWIG